MQQLLDTTEPDHYIFTACENGEIDSTRPQKSCRTAWRHLTQAVECPQCGLLQKPEEFCRDKECKADIRKGKSPLVALRFHDLRHHAITELTESQASEQTIMAIAGHVSPKMLSHYSQGRIAAKRAALDALSGKPDLGWEDQSERGGNVTIHVTNAANPQSASASC